MLLVENHDSRSRNKAKAKLLCRVELEKVGFALGKEEEKTDLRMRSAGKRRTT